MTAFLPTPVPEQIVRDIIDRAEMIGGLTGDHDADFSGLLHARKIANVVDPNFTVVAKMRKSLLPTR